MIDDIGTPDIDRVRIDEELAGGSERQGRDCYMSNGIPGLTLKTPWVNSKIFSFYYPNIYSSIETNELANIGPSYRCLLEHYGILQDTD